MEWPVFEGTEGEKVTKIIDWMLKKIKLKRWTVEEFYEKTFSRSPEQVIREGHTGYRFPCVDLTPVAAEMLLANGFQPTIVFDTHRRKGESGIHLTVQFMLNEKPSHLRIGRNEIQVVPGFMKETERRTIIKEHKLRQSQKSTPYFQLFGIHNMEELRKKAGVKYLGLFEGKLHRINSRTSRLGAMVRRARFRAGRAVRKPFRKKKGI